MSAYIYDKLKSLIETNAYPMHMPGHKRNSDIFPTELYKWDITETGDVDNLHHPTGIIYEAQNAMAEAVGADQSFFLVNGGSSGVAASIMATVGEGDKILVASNCHKSVYSGLISSGAEPVYIFPQITGEGICGGIAPSDLFRALDDEAIKAVVITSPTYEGFCCDIATLADIVHKYNDILIVDECHGAHFPFSNKFPKSAIELGADIVINSWHKTLPCPNQSAVLSIKGDRIDVQRLKDSIYMMTTTSPSYPMMAAMDYMRDLLVKDRNLMTVYTDALIEARHLMAHCKSLKLIGDSIKDECNIFDYDIGKFTIMVRTDMSGYDLAKILLDKYNIQIEMAAPHHIIAMTSVADTPKAIMSFAKAIVDIDKKCERIFIEKTPCIVKNDNIGNMTPRNVFYSKKENIKLKDSVGRISGENIVAYPPGFPLLSMGQRIKSEHIELIEKYLDCKAEVIGVENGEISVVEE